MTKGHIYFMSKTLQLFTGAVHSGLQPEHIDRDTFKAQKVTAEGKDYWLVEKQEWPFTVCQVCEFSTQEDFTAGLQKVLGIPNWAEYIEGDLTFLIHRGNNNRLDINQDNAQQIADAIHQSLRDAAQWWHQYGVMPE